MFFLSCKVEYFAGRRGFPILAVANMVLCICFLLSATKELVACKEIVDFGYRL